MRYYIVTIFPEELDSFLSIGILGQARAAGAIEIETLNLRDFTDDPHRTVDDRPYGGGAGMVMKVAPFVRAIEKIRSEFTGSLRVILLSAQGKLFTQTDAIRYSKLDGLALLCGRYEGVDERVLAFVDEEVSIGDYVLAGGEIAAAAIVEATARMIPGVVGKYDSVESDSFFGRRRLGPPQYTRPPVFRGLPVPDVLLSGDHEKIASFREEAAWRKTAANRPDLLGLKGEDG